jgi:hypothetical protein
MKAIMKRIEFHIAMLLSTILGTSSAFAHSGRTDSNGCHTNHKTGDYHCH